MRWRKLRRAQRLVVDWLSPLGEMQLSFSRPPKYHSYPKIGTMVLGDEGARRSATHGEWPVSHSIPGRLLRSTAAALFAALFVVGLAGFACSSSGSGPKSIASDAGAASGGQAGSTISSGTTGGTSGTISPGGAGGGSTAGAAGTGGVGGQGGTAGSPPSYGGICYEYLMCNLGDHQVAMGGPSANLSGDCPPESECYSSLAFDGLAACGSVLCVLPGGVHCDDPLLCNPGDTLTTSDTACKAPGIFCYRKTLCAQSIVCETWRTTACSSTSSDGGLFESRDASVDGGLAGRIPCCGDGIVDPDHGEECDLGPLNGVCTDASGHPVEGCPAGTGTLCLSNCITPVIHM